MRSASCASVANGAKRCLGTTHGLAAIVGMKRASTNSCHHHADGELVSVAMVRRQHAAGTQEAYRTAPIVDNRTQSTSLSAIINKRRYGSTTPGPSSVLLPPGVRKGQSNKHADASVTVRQVEPTRGAVLASLQVSYCLAYSSTILLHQPWPGGGSRRPCYAFRRPRSAFKQSCAIYSHNDPFRLLPSKINYNV